MGNHLESPRNTCALIGALQTIQAIEGFVPIIHSTAGCGLQQYLGGNSGGAGGVGWTEGMTVSSSNISEKHVVFGGSSRLREQIKNTVKVIRGDLYIVLTGCATEMVGDDIPAMSKEAREQGFPVIHAGTPGFRGGVHRGYELAVKALVEQLPSVTGEPGDRIPGLVNILGIVPQQDVFWQGNLAELQRVLEKTGLTVNTLFGIDGGLDAWRRIGRAELNIVVSPWGVEAAQLLEEKYGTPYLDLKGLPVGAEGTSALLLGVTEKLGLDNSRTEEIRRSEERLLNYHVARMADTYFTAGFQKEFALVGETAQVLGLTGFLTDVLGLLPMTIVITDNPPVPCRMEIVEELLKITGGTVPNVVFSEDGGEIGNVLAASDTELIIGSSLEAETAGRLQIPLLQVSFPVSDRLILGRGYAGYRGAVAFIEDLGSVLMSK